MNNDDRLMGRDLIMYSYLRLLETGVDRMHSSISSMNYLLETGSSILRDYMDTTARISIRQQQGLGVRGRRIGSSRLNRIRTNNRRNYINRSPMTFSIPINRPGTFVRSRNNLQTFINNTLNANNSYSNPANPVDISNNTTEMLYSRERFTNQDRCVISQQLFDESSNIIRINRCGHIFGRDSLLQWFETNSRCPICRYDINTSTIPLRRQSNIWQFDRVEPIRQPVSESTQTSQPPAVNTPFSFNYPNNGAVTFTSGPIMDFSFNIFDLSNTLHNEEFINRISNNLTNQITSAFNDISNNIAGFDFSFMVSPDDRGGNDSDDNIEHNDNDVD